MLDGRYAGKFPITVPTGATVTEGQWLVDQKLALPSAGVIQSAYAPAAGGRGSSDRAARRRRVHRQAGRDGSDAHHRQRFVAGRAIGQLAGDSRLAAGCGGVVGHPVGRLAGDDSAVRSVSVVSGQLSVCQLIRIAATTNQLTTDH